MSVLTSILFWIVYYGATLGYPAYKVYQNQKENKIERIWVLYFLVAGIFAILESTLLLPVKYM